MQTNKKHTTLVQTNNNHQKNKKMIEKTPITVDKIELIQFEQLNGNITKHISITKGGANTLIKIGETNYASLLKFNENEQKTKGGDTAPKK